MKTFLKEKKEKSDNFVVNVAFCRERYKDLSEDEKQKLVEYGKKSYRMKKSLFYNYKKTFYVTKFCFFIRKKKIFFFLIFRLFKLPNEIKTLFTF